MKSVTRIDCSRCGQQFNHHRECRFDSYRCPKCGKKHTEADEKEVRLEPLPGGLEGDEVDDAAVGGTDASPGSMKVYLINSTAGHTKIGISHNPQSRKSDLQTGSPLELELVAAVEPTTDAERYESILHERYSEHRARGEWFDLPEEKFSSLLSEFQDRGRVMPETVSD